jgi:hypothetical protein
VPRNSNSNLFVKGLDTSIDNKALHDTFSGSVNIGRGGPVFIAIAVNGSATWEDDISKDSNDIHNPLHFLKTPKKLKLWFSREFPTLGPYHLGFSFFFVFFGGWDGFLG